MAFFYWLLAIGGGAAGIFQNGVNRKMAGPLGLARSVHINNALLLGVGLIALWLLSRTSLSHFFEPENEDLTFHWWYLVPGLVGLYIIIASPIAISKLGAAKTTAAVIASQMVFSLIWDKFFEGAQADNLRVAGAGAIIAGALMLGFSK